MSSVKQAAPFDSTIKQNLGQLSLGDAPSGKVCIPNISESERRKRLMSGVISLVLALVILAVMMAAGLDRLWRLPLILFFFGATTGYFQWRDKTCVGHVMQGTRKTGDTTEKVEDAGEIAQLRYQARQVQIKAFLAAIPLTVIALALPVLG